MEEDLKLIEELVQRKSGNWDFEIVCGNKRIPLAYALYSYAETLSRLTNNEVTIEEIIDKLSNNLDVLRFHDFKESDSIFKYDGMPVTSDEYKETKKNYFGAHFVTSDDNKTALALYDKTSSKSGIDFDSVEDVFHTLFHELTHIMGLKYTNEADMVVEVNGRKYLNTRDGGTYHGISTMEVENGEIRHNEHNKIDEGFVELIAKTITKSALNLDVLKDEHRYGNDVSVAQSIFESYGIDKIITDYIRNPEIIIEKLEGIPIDYNGYHSDGLHFLGDLYRMNKAKKIDMREATEISNNVLNEIDASLKQDAKTY